MAITSLSGTPYGNYAAPQTGLNFGEISSSGSPQTQYAAMLRQSYAMADAEQLPYENLAIAQMMDPALQRQSLDTALGFATAEGQNAAQTHQESAAILRSRYNVNMREADRNIVTRQDRETEAAATVTSRNMTREAVRRRDDQLLIGG